MILDCIIAAVIFVWAVYGYRKGFIRQIFVLVGTLAIVFLAAPMADLIEEILSKEFDMMMTGRYVRGFLLAGCSGLLYVLTQVVGSFLQSTLVRGIPVAEKTNHILGTILGIIASVTAVYFVLCVCSIGKDKIEEYAPRAHQFVVSSECFQIADANNPFVNFDFFKDVKKYKPRKAESEPAESEPAESEPAMAGKSESAQAEPKPSVRRPVKREAVRDLAEPAKANENAAIPSGEHPKSE